MGGPCVPSRRRLLWSVGGPWCSSIEKVTLYGWSMVFPIEKVNLWLAFIQSHA